MPDGLAAPAGTTSLSSDAAPCHRAGGVQLPCRHQPARRACSTCIPYISLVRGGATPSCPAGSISVLPAACSTGQSHQRASRLFRAMRRPAIVPDVFTHRATVRRCDGPAAPAGITSSEAPGHADGACAVVLRVLPGRRRCGEVGRSGQVLGSSRHLSAGFILGSSSFGRSGQVLGSKSSLQIRA